MIDKLTYDEILNVSIELKENASIISMLIQDKNIQELQDFVATVEGYSKYLETIVEINKDADKALQELKNQSKGTSNLWKFLYIFI